MCTSVRVRPITIPATEPFEIFEEDFRKTAMDYLCFQNNIDTKELGDRLLNSTMYTSELSSDEKSVIIKLKKGGKLDD